MRPNLSASADTTHSSGAVLCNPSVTKLAVDIPACLKARDASCKSMHLA